jgi:translation initiation factor IF-2
MYSLVICSAMDDGNARSDENEVQAPIMEVEDGNDNQVQAPIMEDGNARSDDRVAREPSDGANVAATPLLGKKKKFMGVEKRAVKQQTATPVSKLKASKVVASSKDRAIILVPSFANGLYIFQLAQISFAGSMQLVIVY